MTDPLTTLLRASDPLPHEPYAAEPASRDTLADASVAVAAAVVAADRGTAARARRSRRRTRLVTLALAGAVVVPTGAWAADRFLAQSGWFGEPGTTENDTSEWINVCASDFPQFFATLPRPTDTPPEGLTWAEIGERIVADKQAGTRPECPPQGAGVMEQVTGLTGSYYIWAEGIWTCRAVQAHRGGDHEAFRANAANAATMMDRLSALGLYGDENWKPIRDGLRAGDFAVISQFYDANTAGEGTCP